MAQKPKVSVVISCYNYGRYLPDAVKSVMAQTYRDFEVIVVNDGSTDDSEAVARGLSERYPGKVRVINQPNQGAYAARNNGIAEAVGEYIVSMDADDMVQPEFLEKTVRLLDEHPDVGIAYTGMERFDENGNITYAFNGFEYDFSVLVEENILPCCNLFRKTAWEAVGGYKKLIGAEDWELWIAMGKAGFIGRLVPEVLFRQRLHGLSKFSYTSSRFREVEVEIKRLHLEVYYPRLCRISSAAAVAALLIKHYVRNLVAHWLYRKFPGVHSAIRKTISSNRR